MIKKFEHLLLNDTDQAYLLKLSERYYVDKEITFFINLLQKANNEIERLRSAIKHYNDLYGETYH